MELQAGSAFVSLSAAADRSLCAMTSHTLKTSGMKLFRGPEAPTQTSRADSGLRLADSKCSAPFRAARCGGLGIIELSTRRHKC